MTFALHENNRYHLFTMDNKHIKFEVIATFPDEIPCLQGFQTITSTDLRNDRKLSYYHWVLMRLVKFQ